jgi:hypothetical protein
MILTLEMLVKNPLFFHSLKPGIDMFIKTIGCLFTSIFTLCFWGTRVFAQKDVELKWAKAIYNNQPFPGSVSPSAITTDAAGNIYVAGSFLSNADFDPGPGVKNLSSAGGNDIFIAKYSAEGNLVFAHGFGNTQNDLADDIAVNAAGEIFITGGFAGKVFFTTGNTGTLLTSTKPNIGDVFFAKFTNDGVLKYARNIGSTYGATARGIAADPEGNIVITGYFSGTIDFDPSPATQHFAGDFSYDAFFAKYDHNGNLVFAKVLAGLNDDIGIAVAISQTQDIWIAGQFSGTIDIDPDVVGVSNLTSAGSQDVFFARFTNTGLLQFGNKIGGTGAESIKDMVVDENANMYLSGSFNSTVDFDPGEPVKNHVSAGQADIFLAGYNQLGQYIFSGSMGNTGMDEGNGLALDGGGNIFVTGVFSGTVDFNPGDGVANLTASGPNDIFVGKFSLQGVYSFSFRVGGSGFENGQAITWQQGKGIICTGNFAGLVDFDPGVGTANKSTVDFSLSNGYLATYNPAGQYRFVSTMGNYLLRPILLPDEGRAVTTDAMGNVYVTGQFTGTLQFRTSPTTTLLVSKGGSDIFFAKFDSTGQPLWAFSMGSTLDDKGLSIKIAHNQHIYVSGNFKREVDFDPGPGVSNLVSAGGVNDTNDDIFMAGYLPDGSFSFAKVIGGTGAETLGEAVLDSLGNLYITGSFAGMADFNPSVENSMLNSAGGTDIFLAKYDSNGNYLFAKAMGGTGTDRGAGLGLMPDGSLILAGYTSGVGDINPGAEVFNTAGRGSFFASYDAAGNFGWGKSFAGMLEVMAISIGKSGKIFIAGDFFNTVDMDPGESVNTITNVPGSFQNNIFFAGYSRTGDFLFARGMGNNFSSHIAEIETDSLDHIFISGSVLDNFDFDPGPVTAMLIRGFTRNGFLAAYDSTGQYLFATGMGGLTYAETQRIALDKQGDIYATGYFSAKGNFGSSISNTLLEAPNFNDIFIARYSMLNNVYKTAINGNWSNPATWMGGQVPPAGAVIWVGHILQIDVNVSCKSILFLEGGQLQVAPGILVDISG